MVRLVDWWREQHCEFDATKDEARRSLGQRLRESLASDAERGLFDNYFRAFKPILNQALPALIPQVYLHYDPAIVGKFRRREILPRQRMDFLMLLPHDVRIVLEVDGQDHFSRGGCPSLSAYAEMVRVDRDLRLLGYEIYRFGANELVGPKAFELVCTFFRQLFETYRVGA